MVASESSGYVRCRVIGGSLEQSRYGVIAGLAGGKADA
jgi:hypothetical protein